MLQPAAEFVMTISICGLCCRQPVSGSGCSPGKQRNQRSYETGASWFVADCPPRADAEIHVFSVCRTLQNINKGNCASLPAYFSPRETHSPALCLSPRTTSASARPLTSARTTLPMETLLPCLRSMLSPPSTDRKGTRSSMSTRSKCNPSKNLERC